MKRRNISKASQERAVLTPSKKTAQNQHDNQRDKGRVEGANNIKKKDSGEPLHQEDASSVTQPLDTNMLLLSIPLFVFVGLPMIAFAWYIMKHQIHIEKEMGSAIAVTIIGGGAIASISYSSNSGLLRIFRNWKISSTERKEKHHDVPYKTEEGTTVSSPEQQTEQEKWIQPTVRLRYATKQEEEDELKDYPLLINAEQRQNLAEKVLPRSLADHFWSRLYSLSRDGDTFDRCLKAIEDERRTLIVIQTTQNQILGGFADVAWKTSSGGIIKTNEGGPDACAFCFQKGEMDKESDLKVFRWTGTNRYTQLVDVKRERLAMGAGGILENEFNNNNDGDDDVHHYAWSVEQNFTVGTTGRCPTFDNEPLCEPKRFEILDFEVYGFSVC